MKTITLVAAVVVATMIVSGRSAIASGEPQQPQYSQFHKPMSPIGPTSEAQCSALAAEWTALCTRISNTHQQCLDANTNTNIKGAGACSKAPCLSLHMQMDECNGAERQQAVAACRAAVKVHTDREAEFKRMQEAHIRAQQQAERERRERLKAEADKYTMEADRQRQIADAYRRNTTKGPVRTEMSDRQAAMLAALQLRAEAAAREHRRALSLPRDHDFVDTNTMPDLSKATALIGRIGNLFGHLGVSTGADIGGWFTEIHDGRRAAAENARVALNDSLRRDFPNEHTFNFGKCMGGDHGAECSRFYTDLSPESEEKWQQYNYAMSRYLGWTNMDRWTDVEKAKFLSKVGGAGVKQIEKWLKEEIKENQNPSWDKPLKNPVQDKMNAELKKQIDKHLKNEATRRTQPSPTPVAPPFDLPSNEEIATEYGRWRQAWDEEQRRRENQRFLDELGRQTPRVSPPQSLPPAPPPAVVSPRR
jgi:hypothetical protein